MCFTVTHSTKWRKNKIQKIYTLNSMLVTLITSKCDVQKYVHKEIFTVTLLMLAAIFDSKIAKYISSFHSSQILTISPAMMPANRTEMRNLRSGG